MTNGTGADLVEWSYESSNNEIAKIGNRDETKSMTARLVSQYNGIEDEDDLWSKDDQGGGRRRREE